MNWTASYAKTPAGPPYDLAAALPVPRALAGHALLVAAVGAPLGISGRAEPGCRPSASARCHLAIDGAVRADVVLRVATALAGAGHLGTKAAAAMAYAAWLDAPRTSSGRVGRSELVDVADGGARILESERSAAPALPGVELAAKAGTGGRARQAAVTLAEGDGAVRSGCPGPASPWRLDAILQDHAHRIRSSTCSLSACDRGPVPGAAAAWPGRPHAAAIRPSFRPDTRSRRGWPPHGDGHPGRIPQRMAAHKGLHRHSA